MGKKTSHKLTLDRQITYQIKVPGEFDDNWSEWARDTSFTVECDEHGLSVTTMTTTADQAALHGLLRLLYSQGLSLISVIWVEVK